MAAISETRSNLLGEIAPRCCYILLSLNLLLEIHFTTFAANVIMHEIPESYPRVHE